MANVELRFIHASDFHLERPLGGVEDIPPALAGTFVDAPFQAATRVFDAAVDEQVDFLLLAGNILQPTSAGPRGLVFLAEQFERLHGRNIPVFWVTGHADAGARWTEVLRLPKNVHLTTNNSHERLNYQRQGRHRVEVLARGFYDRALMPTAAFQPSGQALPIAFGNGRLDASPQDSSGVAYWALGGRHRRGTRRLPTTMIHYPGTPQGRSPRESGPRGCTLVQVNESLQIRTRFIATDVARWHQEVVRLEDPARSEDLARLLDQRAAALRETAPVHDLLVCWKIQAPLRLTMQLRHGGLAKELLKHLCDKYGNRRLGVWSLALEAEMPASLPEAWYEEQTIRGEFLQQMQTNGSTSGMPLDIKHCVAEKHLSGSLAAALLIKDPQARRRVLTEATQFGADLLSGEESQA